MFAVPSDDTLRSLRNADRTDGVDLSALRNHSHMARLQKTITLQQRSNTRPANICNCRLCPGTWLDPLGCR